MIRSADGRVGAAEHPEAAAAAAPRTPKAMLYTARFIPEDMLVNRPEGAESRVRAERSAPVPQISIVIPAYNESENLVPLWEELRSTLVTLKRSFEVIIVDDGSRDATLDVLRSIRRAAPELRILRFGSNSGQTAAFLAGFAAARGDVVVTLDADRQNDPADIASLLARIPEYDAAVGFRARRRDSWVRLASSRVANAVRNALSGDDIIDTGCTLKAFRRECLDELPRFSGMHRFFPTLIRMRGFRVCQLPVGHRPRVAGRSKYGIGNRVFRAFHDLLAVRWMKSRRIHYTVTEES